MAPVTLRTERLVLSLPQTGCVDAIYEACQEADHPAMGRPAEPVRAEARGGLPPIVARNWRERLRIHLGGARAQ